MALDNTKNVKNLKISSGTVIVLQGQNTKSLNLLHSGTVELLVADLDPNGMSEQDIIAVSRSLTRLTGETVFGEFFILSESPYAVSYRALEQCVVSIYPFSSSSIARLPEVNATLAAFILKTAEGKLKGLMGILKKINSFEKLVQKFSDNIAVITGKMNSKHNTGTSLWAEAQEIYKSYTENGGTLPSAVSTETLLVDNSESLGKSYGSPGLSISDMVDTSAMRFFKALQNAAGQEFIPMIKAQPYIFVYHLQKYSDYVAQILYKVNSALKLLNQDCKHLFASESSWFDEVLKSEQFALNDMGFVNDDFNHQLMDIVAKMEDQYRGLFNKDIDSIRPKYIDLMNKVKEGTASDATADSIEIDIETQQKIDLLNDMYTQIAQFAAMSEEQISGFRDMLTEFKKLPDSKANTDEARKIRRRLTTEYWKIYGKVFLKTVQDPYPPLPIKLMLRYGVLDETLLSTAQLAAIVRIPEEDAIDGIYFIDEWLRKIYNDEEYPSISELGETFDKMKKDAEMHGGKKKKKKKHEDDLWGDTPDLEGELDTQEAKEKLIFEIEQFIQSAVRVCSESIPTAFPILTKDYVPDNLINTIVTKDKIKAALEKVLSIDYSVFHREVTFSGLGRPELIIQRVVPDILIMPSAGINMMMWQDLSYMKNERGNIIRRRGSKGRFACPIFLLADNEKVFYQCCAKFRWELCRSIYESLWMDPVEGGLTGQYYDYITYYKKNPNLSVEAKAEVATQIRSFRKQQREIFTDDYVKWLTFEKEGIAKVNKEVRKIFYRMIPFAKEIRDKLENLPIYSDDAYRFKNIRTKKLRELDIRYRKWQEMEGGLPQELQENLEFYQC